MFRRQIQKRNLYTATTLTLKERIFELAGSADTVLVKTFGFSEGKLCISEFLSAPATSLLLYLIFVGVWGFFLGFLNALLADDVRDELLTSESVVRCKLQASIAISPCSTWSPPSWTSLGRLLVTPCLVMVRFSVSPFDGSADDEVVLLFRTENVVLGNDLEESLSEIEKNHLYILGNAESICRKFVSIFPL